MIGVDIKVALLSNFTLRGLDDRFKASARRYGIDIFVYNGEYGQWQQEILGARLYEFKPDIVYVIVDFDGIDDQVEMLSQLALKTSVKIVVCGYGAKHNLGEYFHNHKQIIVFDFEGWLEQIGKDDNWNTKYRELGDLRLHPNAFAPLARELVAYLIPLAGKTKKCLVLDLDNTLWGGIIGEDGLSGIKLAPTGAGAPYYEFQKLIKDFKDRGIILAIASSNNEADVEEVWAKHEHMILKKDDWAAWRINWNNKAENVRQLATELNIGLDAMVFIDDDPRNRQLIRETIPEIEVLEMPVNPAEYSHTLSDYKGFASFGVTAEDKKRTSMYTDEKRRQQFKEQVIDLDSFLRGLGLTITIQPVSDAHLPRAAQLTQKTNQFNLTTRRYQEVDIRNILATGAKAWILDVKDKFGEYGLTGLIIARNGKRWEIDTFLMSCRVLGKRVEEEFLGQVLNQLRKQDPKKIIGQYLPTVKNEQVKDFYQKFGFTRRAAGSGSVWQRTLADFTFQPLDFINTDMVQ